MPYVISILHSVRLLRISYDPNSFQHPPPADPFWDENGCALGVLIMTQTLPNISCRPSLGYEKVHTIAVLGNDQHIFHHLLLTIPSIWMCAHQRCINPWPIHFPAPLADDSHGYGSVHTDGVLVKARTFCSTSFRPFLGCECVYVLMYNIISKQFPGPPVDPFRDVKMWIFIVF